MPKEGQVTNIAVTQNARNKGVATALIRSVLEFVHAKDITFILLEVRRTNLTAQKIYSKFGFEQLSIRKNYYEKPKEDAIVMKYINISCEISCESF